MADQRISQLTDYTTPLNADVLPIVDTANVVTKKVSWSNIKATLKAYFDTLYPSGSGTSTGTNTGDQIISDATITTTDITTNNFTTAKHGFVPKGTNVGNFLKDDGTWGAVSPVDASTIVKGVVEEATTAEINTETAAGGTGAELFMNPSKFASSVAGVDAGFFGDGSNGDVTISGTTTLTSDMNYNNLTINSSQILNTANFRVFVKGTLTNGGTIRCNGLPGVTSTGGTAVASGTLLGGANGANATAGGGGGGSGAGIVMIFARTVATQGTIEAIGRAGAAGATSGSSGSGSNGTTIANSIIQTGTGGAGGQSGGGQAGGIGGVITTSSKMSRGSAILLLSMLDGTARLAGGAGGAGGGTNGATGQGGGGGGQGGIVLFAYRKMTTSGTISVAGGAGGALFNAGANGVAGSSGLAISLQI